MARRKPEAAESVETQPVETAPAPEQVQTPVQTPADEPELVEPELVEEDEQLEDEMPSEAERKGCRAHDEHGNVRPADGRWPLHAPEQESEVCRKDVVHQEES